MVEIFNPEVFFKEVIIKKCYWCNELKSDHENDKALMFPSKYKYVCPRISKLFRTEIVSFINHLASLCIS